ncbi:MAG: hypothetical protein ACOC33_02520 [bacterium]
MKFLILTLSFIIILGAETAQPRRSRKFTFDETEVQGYLDNPTPIYIMDNDNPNSELIILDRCFREALKINIDKETVELIIDQ